MKKTISRIGCFLLAILLGLYSVAIPADADALSPGEWFVTGYYRVTSDGVMGYNGRYVGWGCTGNRIQPLCRASCLCKGCIFFYGYYLVLLL